MKIADNNILKVAILLVLGGAAPLMADEPAAGPLTFEQAQELGRAKSRFLKEDRHSKPELQKIPTADVAHFQKVIGPILNKSCVDCHGPENSEGQLRVDKLNPDLLSGPDVEHWRAIYSAVSNSEMPPDDSPDDALTEADRGRIVDWLSDEMNKASFARRNEGERSSFRRMTKYEYNYALQDLLGLPFDLAKTLPPETASEDGFKNSSEMLQMSAMQFETYRQIGLKALKRATVRGERPEPVTYIISMEEEFEKAESDSKGNRRNRSRLHILHQKTGDRVSFQGATPKPRPAAPTGQTPAVSPAVLVLPNSNELKLNLDRFLPDTGVMRVRLRAGRSTMRANEYASLRLIFSAHTSNNANFSQVISERDVPVTAAASDPQFLHFDIPLGDIQRNPFRKRPTNFPRRDEFLTIRNVSNASNRADPLHLYIDHIEISAPFYEQWPPQTHRNIFITSKNRHDEELYGREVLTRFLRRVWRRPATAKEVDLFMSLFAKYRPDFATFEDAMVEVLATALATPEFLYITQKAPIVAGDKAKGISDFELASRLSIFLWSSIPDDELLKLAEQGKLQDPAVVDSQIMRMLADPRAQRFSKNFVQQWLGLDGLDSVTHVNDSALRAAMEQEPIAFFEELLQHNGSVMNFIHSDFAVVNQRLAAHYKIPDVYGPHFRKVPVSPEKNRGGLLTAAAMLTMNSDGKDSHPLKRGVWLLERILNAPPPPPPPNVPEVDLTDPEILKMSLKERIEDHRNKPACNSCHTKIDPWGIALENYDALGAYRTRIKNKPVDATSELFNRHELAGADGLKQYLLLDRQDQFARAMVHKMTAYALGRPISFSDHAAINSMTTEFRKRGDRLADLIRIVTSSELFRSK